MKKLKLWGSAILMGVGIGGALLATPKMDGQMLALCGLMFGVGLHWYRKSFGFKSFVVGALMTCAFPLLAGAVMQGQPLLGLMAFLFIGGTYHMVKK